MKNKRYKLVGVSGTFSPPLHSGHVTLISKAFEISEQVMIGLTTDEMTRHKTLNEKIPSYEIRKKNIIDFLTKKNLINRTIIIKLTDPYGPSIEDQGLEAIIVSTDTRYMDENINRKRKEKNLPPLDFVTIDMVLAKDGNPISSTRMRQGIIDEKGNLNK
ncbi:MAG: pantetheine-phosphate adenylyltransferase [Candidatus Lokiarchaeota archaeon]|nr:pantetheine-phosphate adenylyltransferase [Candidatus Lokiarchaeota archaeon]